MQLRQLKKEKLISNNKDENSIQNICVVKETDYQLKKIDVTIKKEKKHLIA